MKSKASRHRLEKLSEYFEENPDFPVPERVQKALRQLEKSHLSDLSMDTISDITQAIQTAVYHSQTRNKFLNLEHGGFIADTVATVAAEADQKAGFKQKFDRTGPDFSGKRKLNTLDAPVFQEWSSRPEDVMEPVMGATFTDMVWNQGMVLPEAKRLEWDNTYVDGMEAIFQKHDMHPEASQIAGKVVPNIRLKNGKIIVERTSPLEAARFDRIQIRDQEFTRDELALLHRLMMDPENRALMRQDGVRFENGNRSLEGITPEIEAAIEAAIGPVFVEIGQYMHQQDNGPTIARANAATQEVAGHPLTLRTNHAPRPSVKEPSYDPNDPLGNAQKFVNFTNDKYGNLKARTRRSGPITVPAKMTGLIDYGINHTFHMNRYSAYLTPYRDMTMMVNALKDKLIEKGGPKFFDYVADRVARTAAPFATKSISDVSALESLLSDAAGGLLALSGPAHISSTLGLLTAASRYEKGGEYMRRAVAEDANPARSRELGEKVLRSPIGKARYRGDNYLREQTGGLLGRRSFFRPRSAFRILTKGISGFEFIISKQKMSMAEQIVEDRGIDRNSPEFEEESLREWERIMYRTENTSVGMELNNALAGASDRGLWARGPMMFMNAVSKQWSALMRARHELKSGDKRTGARLAGYGVAALAIEAMVRDLFSREKIEGTWPERIVKRSALNIVTMIPVVGIILEQAARQALDIRTWPGESNILLDAAKDAASAGGQVASEIAKAVSTGSADREEFDKALVRFMFTTAQMFGLPLQRAVNLGEQIGGADEGTTNKRDKKISVNF